MRVALDEVFVWIVTAAGLGFVAFTVACDDFTTDVSDASEECGPSPLSVACVAAVPCVDTVHVAARRTSVACRPDQRVTVESPTSAVALGPLIVCRCARSGEESE